MEGQTPASVGSSPLQRITELEQLVKALKRKNDLLEVQVKLLTDQAVSYSKRLALLEGRVFGPSSSSSQQAQPRPQETMKASGKAKGYVQTRLEVVNRDDELLEEDAGADDGLDQAYVAQAPVSPPLLAPKPGRAIKRVTDDDDDDWFQPVPAVKKRKEDIRGACNDPVIPQEEQSSNLIVLDDSEEPENGIAFTEEYFEDLEEENAREVDIGDLGTVMGLEVEHYGEDGTEIGDLAQWRKAFPWNSDVDIANHAVFQNTSFRRFQREAINATISGRDCFVLMPTGAGKSLIYQLPAICREGVSLVVSPLVSLIHDQVVSLLKVQVNAKYLSADMSKGQVAEVYADLKKQDPETKILYVTPERVAKSKKFMTALKKLHSNGKLARVVIDEAHCISQWGHDFRTDYMQLKLLRAYFPNVPLLALTATATEQVKRDIITQLGMKNVILFVLSFNRPNLIYEVRAKSNQMFDEIVDFIKQNYHRKCGIIYCYSRNESERVFDHLHKNGIRAEFYHASLHDTERTLRHDNWLKGSVHVMVATVAFGIGIDKPDVRFVIHCTIPKSIEEFYQGSGRAGRDGETSHCLLYYTYAAKDKGKVQALISGRHGVGKLLEFISYCENKTLCRRTMLLQYFGEKFDPKGCNSMCDNCIQKRTVVESDFTKEAKSIISAVRDIGGGTYNLGYVVDVFRGSKSKQLLQNGHQTLPAYGAGRKVSKQVAEMITRHMVLRGILVEDAYFTGPYGSVTVKVKLGPKARAVERGEEKLNIAVGTAQEKRPKKGKSKEKGKEKKTAVKRNPKKRKKDEADSVYSESELNGIDYGE